MRTQNRVVVRCLDGSKIKGYTLDFTAQKERFHVVAPDDEARVFEVASSQAKAVFYVRTFEGQPGRPSPGLTKDSLAGVPGTKLKVTFRDGEVLYGTTNGYAPGRKGFFVFPADRSSNNERVYVLSAATQAVETWR